jgi:SAM-dependent methyltransferase
MAMAADKINYYDDDEISYERFWDSRDYEHYSELIAIRRLLRGRRYDLALDYGGGYGRLTPTLLEFADKAILADPSRKQLDIAKKKLREMKVEYKLQAKKDNVPADDASIDLLVMVRVSHHLPEPDAVFAEIARVLKPGGEALIEVASEAHFVNRLRYLKRLNRVPKEPVAIGWRANGLEDDTPFVNHNPKTVEAALAKQGLRVERKLSVSNFRNPFIKKHVSLKALLALEKPLQSLLAPAYFGPSIFLLVKKD